jgi:PsbP
MIHSFTHQRKMSETVSQHPSSPRPTTMMKTLTTAILLLALFAKLEVSGYSATSGASIDRRSWISTASSSVAAIAFGLPNVANAAAASSSLTDFNDPQHGFSIKVPADWIATNQQLPDRRKINLWTDPSDPATLLFIAYTPVRDDFTSLGSFGSVDQVAEQTILPKGELMGVVDVDSKMLSAVADKQAYFFDYRQAAPKLPLTHFRTIFTLQQGATGGAGAVLVTVTAQTPEKRYGELQSMFDQVINSYGKSKA